MKFLTASIVRIHHRANVRTIRKAALTGGMTLLDGCPVRYQTGYQVGIKGFTFNTPEEVSRFLHTEGRDGCWGIWVENGLWYVDQSVRVISKKEAINLGVEHNQLAIYGWKEDQCFNCK